MSNASVRYAADASAIINLNATQCPAEILSALSQKLVVVDVVAAELEEGRAKGRRDADQLSALRTSGLIEIVRLGDPGEVIFERLVAGPALATLDDGEAATIAYAVEHTLSVVTEDGKARRICKEFFPGVQRRCSCEIFRTPAVIQRLGRSRLAEAVLNALRLARMKVLPEHLEWVIGLIGEEEARACPSLPRTRRKASTRSQEPKL